MAYQSKNLSALGYANGFTLWHYRTSDLAAEVDNAGYFNAGQPDGAGRRLHPAECRRLAARPPMAWSWSSPTPAASST